MTTDAIDRAKAELREMQRAARKTRRAFVASPDSAFVQAMQAVISQYLAARAAGVSREDGIRGIEMELRSVWPKSVSKFRPDCDNCDDTGYVDHVCWDQHRCGRDVCAKNPERQHPYVEACHCAKGDKKRARVSTPDDAILAAGRTAKKKRGFTRFGA